jgi:hypothetical protein
VAWDKDIKMKAKGLDANLYGYIMQLAAKYYKNT